MNHNEIIDDILIADFDIVSHPFRKWFSECLGTEDLEGLHLRNGVTPYNYAQHVAETRKHCEERISDLQMLVKNFIESFVTPRFGQIGAYQALPTIRSHFAVNDPALRPEADDILILGSEDFLAKYYFHQKRLAMFHRDKDYGLTDGSVNMWIPVTNVSGSNSLWIGSSENGGADSKPVSMDYGQVLFFDGANRWHGAVWNTSGSTRISFDVRFRPETFNADLLQNKLRF